MARPSRERTAGVRVHATPFRPHGTGLKERCARRLAGRGGRHRQACADSLVAASPSSRWRPRPAAGLGPLAHAAADARALRVGRRRLLALAGAGRAARGRRLPARPRPERALSGEPPARGSSISRAQGDESSIPRYESAPGACRALIRHALVALNGAVRRSGARASRSSSSATRAAAGSRSSSPPVTPAIGVVPAAVMSVFPGELNPQAEEVVDLALARPTRRG